MAYLPSNADIGPNSLEAPSAEEVAASRACIHERNREAADGRIRTFLSVPPLSSFDSPTVAGDAARILHQSALGRASILTPGAPESHQHVDRFRLDDVMLSAPEVVPLNDRGDYCGGGPVRIPPPPPKPQMIMPEVAPVPVTIASRSRRGADAPVVFVNANPPDTSWLIPAGGLEMQNLGTRYMGYSGYAPPWGDAGLEDLFPAPIEGKGPAWLPWLLGGAALVMLGSAVGVKRARKRRARR